MRSVLAIAGAPQLAAPEPTTLEKILDAAAALIAERGEADMKVRDVAVAARVTMGGVQHYFKTKKDLVDATNQHVLRQISAIVDVPDTHDVDILAEVGKRLVNIFVEQPHLMSYVSRSFVDKGEVGSVMFRWFYEFADQQGDLFATKGMLPPGIDRTWAVLNIVILRVGAFVFSDYIDQILPQPFRTPEQIHRWDAAFSNLMRHGQLIEPPQPAEAPAE